MRTTTRTAGFVAVIAIATALLSPFVAVSASAAPLAELTGTTSGTAWRDNAITAQATVGQTYTSTLLGPSEGGPFAVSIEDGPSWLSASIDPTTQVITISGLPDSADSDLSFTVRFSASSGENIHRLDFAGFTVLPDTTPTTTTVTTAAFSHYGAVNLQASVSSSTSGGTVDFYLGSTLVGTGAVGGTGTASYTGAVPASLVGSSAVVKAVFSGDTTFAGSTSTSDPSVYIYGDRVVAGSFLSNGIGLEGRTIRLLNASDLGYSGLSDTTNAAGEYSIQVPVPTSLADAQRGFVVEDFGAQLYYSASAAWKQPNVQDVYAATSVYEADWAAPLTLLLSTDPTWSDQALAQPRMGESYSDGVVATTFGASSTITYSLTGDPLPSWLTFSNGAFSSTGPTDQLAHTFTVSADSAYGVISKQFTLQAGAAAVPPTFTDTDIADLQVGTPLTDAIAATGDATISYSSTTLPPGLTLDSETGTLTGTPTTAGDYVVTFTASNGTDPDATFTWEPTIAAAPDIELVLNFAAGTTIDDADTEIGADGLKVGSTYTLYMHSTPVLLYTGTVGPTGSFLHTVTLPANTPVGAHELILTGVAPDGTVMTAHAWFTLLSNGRIGAISYSGPLSFTLAFTGSEPLVPLGIAGALLLAGYLALRRSRGVRSS